MLADLVYGRYNLNEVNHDRFITEKGWKNKCLTSVRIKDELMVQNVEDIFN